MQRLALLALLVPLPVAAQQASSARGDPWTAPLRIARGLESGACPATLGPVVATCGPGAGAGRMLLGAKVAPGGVFLAFADRGGPASRHGDLLRVTIDDRPPVERVTACLTSEGVRFEVWRGTPRRSTRLAVRVASLAYDVEASCPDVRAREGNFAGTYAVGRTSAEVTPVKQAYEVRWRRGTGVEMVYCDAADPGGRTFVSDSMPTGRNRWILDDASWCVGTFVRADDQRFPVRCAAPCGVAPRPACAPSG